MLRRSRFALAVTLMVALSACQPAASLDFLMTPLAATSGELRVEVATDSAVPPALVLEQTGTPSRSFDEREDRTVYTVVMNQEEQYSIWPAGREVPFGWREVGKTGSKAECLDYIREVWTDMRPLSLRQKMGEPDFAQAVQNWLDSLPFDQRSHYERLLPTMTEAQIRRLISG